MWGRQGDKGLIEFLSRNTPTHVGKTKSQYRSPQVSKKHPHACGEDQAKRQYSHPHRETPPRMWGRLISPLVKEMAIRNTPTHVGKTPQLTTLYIQTKKHPHACGEDVCALNDVKNPTETPPRMWGRPIQMNGTVFKIRNTPTHVGKTIPGSKIEVRTKKHPHACGEDLYPL